MKALFKYPRKIEGQHYAPGMHTMPDALAKHWYFLALINNHDVTMIEKPGEEVQDVSPSSPAAPVVDAASAVQPVVSEKQEEKVEDETTPAGEAEKTADVQPKAKNKGKPSKAEVFVKNRGKRNKE